jgi:hypothetical protein
MEISRIPDGYENKDVGLAVEEKNVNNIELWLYNEKDHYFNSNFNVEGTEEEIKIIKEFCKKLSSI